MNFYRSVLGQGEAGSYTVTSVNAGGIKTIHKSSCASMFVSNSSFNSDVIIGNNVSDISLMLAYCTSFNRNVVIPSGVTNCAETFRNCSSLNQNILIPNGVKNCAFMFWRCSSLNQNFVIPSSVENMYSMFINCSLGGTGCSLKINSVGRTVFNFNCAYMLQGKSTSKRLNIFCNNLDALRNGNLNGVITWTSMTNGFYNSAQNIYLYNNYSG